MAKLLVGIFFSIFTLELFAADFSKLFQERAKCLISIKYILETEEDRRQLTTTGMLVDAQGLVLVPASEIPTISPKCLKDFKAYIYKGSQEGYAAQYLGKDSQTGINFIRIKGGASAEMEPYTKFGKASYKIGQDIYGVATFGESSFYEPYLFHSYVSTKGFRPLEMGASNLTVSATGGPVFDAEGKVIGWALSNASENKILLLPDGASASVKLIDDYAASFISIDEFEKIAKRVPSDPSGDPCGWLGVVGLQFLKKEVSDFMGLKDKFGLVISDIIKSSPADKAGLKKGDIIVGFNGKMLERLSSDSVSRDKFTMALRATKPDEKITLDIIKDDGKLKTVPVTMAATPRDVFKADFKYFRRLGFSVMESTMDEAIARRMLEGLKDFPVVRFVKPNSPASSATPAALGRGDVIREINSKPVKNYAEAIELLSKINDDKTVKELVILAEDYRETKVVKIKLD